MKYIWLFSENLSATANNNSYYFWKYIVNKYDDVAPYFILEKTSENKSFVQNHFNAREKEYVVWRNSLKHVKLFESADMLFVTLSYRDVLPEKTMGISWKLSVTQPLVYLSHGDTAFKRIYYKNNYVDNCLSKFVNYNPCMFEVLQNVNGFKKYQIYNAGAQPRFVELVRRAKQHCSSFNSGKNILWFITWREYFGANEETDAFIQRITSLVQNDRFKEFLNKTRGRFTVCLHPFFSTEQVYKIREAIPNDLKIRLVTTRQVDIMDELASNQILITDYSSVAFDFTFLRKPVILYQPDLEQYLKRREFYCSHDELKEVAIQDEEELVRILEEGRDEVNPFFEKRLSQQFTCDEVLEGKHLDAMYKDFLERQKNCIAILGYDFSGQGGTVSATKALAEGLLEKDCLVRLYTLKREQRGVIPPGLPICPMMRRYKRSKLDKLRKIFYRSKKYLSHLSCDPGVLHPACGKRLTDLMKHIHAKTVISTRESLHLFLCDCTSPMVENKLFYFHTSASLVDSIFPDCISKLSKKTLDKAVFVTEKNRLHLCDKGLSNYKRYLVSGNTLDSDRFILREAVELPSEESKNIGVFLLRLDRERIESINRVLSFGEYLKKIENHSVKIYVYGGGSYAKEFASRIENLGLKDYIVYKGRTSAVKSCYKKSGFVVDFSPEQSFGMLYIEAILNGRMVYCYHNEGSDEVLKDIPESFFDTNEELFKKIQDNRNITRETLLKHYDLIYSRYSREVVSQKLLNLINDNEL